MPTALDDQTDRPRDQAAPPVEPGTRTIERFEQIEQALFAFSGIALSALLATLVAMLWTAAAWATGMRPQAPAIVLTTGFALAAIGAALARAAALADRRAFLAVIAILAVAAALIIPAHPAVLLSSPSIADSPLALTVAVTRVAGIPMVAVAAALWMLCTTQPHRANNRNQIAGAVAFVAYPILIEPIASLQDLARIWTVIFTAVAMIAMGLAAWRLTDAAAPTVGPDRRTIAKLLIHSAVPSAALVVTLTEVATSLTPLALPAAVVAALTLAAAVLPKRFGTGQAVALPLPSPLFLALTLMVVAVIALPENSRYRLPIALIALLIGTGLHVSQVREHVRMAPAGNLPIAIAGLAVGALVGTILLTGQPIPPLPSALILLVCAAPVISASSHSPRRVAAILLLSLGIALVLPAISGILGGGSRIALATVMAAAIITIIRLTMGWPEQNLIAAASLLNAAALFLNAPKVVHAERGTWAPYRIVREAGGHRLVAGSSAFAHDPPDTSASLSRLFDAVRHQKRGDPALDANEPSPLLIGIIGMTGAPACATSPADVVRYFATDQTSAHLSTDPRWFPSYTRCTSTARIVAGDPRTTLAGEPDDAFDVLILDTAAFPSPPFHLLDAERLSAYLSKIAPTGILIIRERTAPITVRPWLSRNLAARSGRQTAIIGDDLLVVTRSGSLATTVAAWPDANGLEREAVSSRHHHVDVLAALRLTLGPRR